MILVTGANGVVGQPLVKELEQKDESFLRVSRLNGLNAVQWDLHQPIDETIKSALQGCNKLIHCAPIWLLPAHLPHLVSLGIRRIVVFSSTSVISKGASTDPQEQRLVEQLSTAEREIQAICEQSNITYTILRPSMIYGYGIDQNVTHIAGFIRRWGFAVIAGKGSGLRQPVHADDLVSASLVCLTSEETSNKTYSLAGGETLTYKDMLTRIFKALGRKPRVISVPVWMLRPALRLSKLLGKFDYTADMANRMNQHLAYDNGRAADDFGYSPESFLMHPDRDLKS